MLEFYCLYGFDFKVKAAIFVNDAEASVLY